jgi:hypothetical protein
MAAGGRWARWAAGSARAWLNQISALARSKYLLISIPHPRAARAHRPYQPTTAEGVSALHSRNMHATHHTTRSHINSLATDQRIHNPLVKPQLRHVTHQARAAANRHQAQQLDPPRHRAAWAGRPGRRTGGRANKHN